MLGYLLLLNKHTSTVFTYEYSIPGISLLTLPLIKWRCFLKKKKKKKQFGFLLKLFSHLKMSVSTRDIFWGWFLN